jgi:hypothetical protein
MTPPNVPTAVSPAASERLYALLPSLLRLRDGEVGQPLRALLRVLERELRSVEADVAQLYDNWFIETCEPWVVPYLADLLGIRHLPGQLDRTLSRRSFVANTLSYRRRKGTPGVLLQLSRDLTDWPGRVVEYAPLVSGSQHLLRPRASRHGPLSLRSQARLDELGSPFDDLTRLADVRSIHTHPGYVSGRHNLPNVGLFLWRRTVVSVVDAVPAPQGPHRFCFSPLGLDQPLYQPDRSQAGQPVRLDTAPAILTPQALRDDLRAGGRTYFSAEQPALAVNSQGQPLAPASFEIRDLSNGSELWAGDKQLAAGRIAIDPVLGRLLVASDFDDAQIRVSYSYPTEGELGDSHFIDASDAPPAQVRLKLPLSQPQADPSLLLSALAPPPAPTGTPAEPHIVQIEDSAHYRWPQTLLSIPAGRTVILRALPGQRPLVRLFDHEAVRSAGEGAEEFPTRLRLQAGAKLILQGLLLAGSLPISAETGSELALESCTLAHELRPPAAPPESGRLLFNPGDFVLRIDKSIVNEVAANSAHLILRDSLLDAGEGSQRVRSARIERSTLFKLLEVREQLEEASDSLFLGRLRLEGRGDGCVRFCFLALGSTVLRRFRCVPAVGEDSRRIPIVLRAPRPDEPGFGQLSRQTSPLVLQGASDGGEIGAMNHLKWQQREADLRATLSEYTRVGYETEIFFED